VEKLCGIEAPRRAQALRTLGSGYSFRHHPAAKSHWPAAQSRDLHVGDERSVRARADRRQKGS